MGFEDILEDREISYPCDCNGNITKIDGYWQCDCCDFKEIGEVKYGNNINLIKKINGESRRL